VDWQLLLFNKIISFGSATDLSLFGISQSLRHISFRPCLLQSPGREWQFHLYQCYLGLSLGWCSKGKLRALSADPAVPLAVLNSACP